MIFGSEYMFVFCLMRGWHEFHTGRAFMSFDRHAYIVRVSSYCVVSVAPGSSPRGERSQAGQSVLTHFLKGILRTHNAISWP